MLKFEFICMYLIIIASLFNTLISSYDNTSNAICYFSTAFPFSVVVMYYIKGRYKQDFKG